MLQPLPARFEYHPPRNPYLAIVHQDRDFLVLDKPSGLLSVPGKPIELFDSVQSRVRERWPAAAMVHRLDKDTSGILVIALNKQALAFISQQFEKRTARKSYVARVWGILEHDSGLVDMPLATDWENKPRQRVDWENGRPSQTAWQVMARDTSATRLRLNPLTGRTHQLRVHMLAIGHVILGDAFYAEGEALAAADRLQLHAETLSFIHPRTGELCEFTIPCPF